jgi:nucleotide-binding universal stress UspA family protein
MHILLATDGSEQAVAAARFIHTIVNPAVLERVTVMAVIRPITSAPFFGEVGLAGLSGEAWESLNEAANTSAKNAIQKTVDALADAAPRIETLIRPGSPADEIVDAAKELGADMIVVGSRGWGEIRSVLLGSVSERVMHLAHCPVLIVRPTEHA